MASPTLDHEYVMEIENAKNKLREVILEKNCAPIMLRLAWHDAGTYDRVTNTGGPNGSIRLEGEYNHAANKGIKNAIDLCQPIKDKFPKISYADLYQVAGVVAVEASGGPKINFVPGRKDSSVVPPEGRLPDASQGASHLREIFSRMGLSDKDIVALSGGHTLGRAHQDNSGFEGQWTSNPLTFDNSYFIELVKGHSDELLKMPTDKCLMEDTIFRSHVENYAKDKDAFFRDYAWAHKKLSELGFIAHASDQDLLIEQYDSNFTSFSVMVGVAITAVAVGFIAMWTELWS